MADINNFKRPLIVDLDGTLVATDTLIESCLLFIKCYPLKIFKLFGWLLKGKAVFKVKVSEVVLPNVKKLPYRDNVIKFIIKAKTFGREIYLITGSNQKIADSVLNNSELFDSVIGSSRKINIKGKRKLNVIREAVGLREFDYIGDSKSDLAIWKHAYTAIICSDNKKLHRMVRKVHKNVVNINLDSGSTFKYWIKELRIYQWSKNVLVFLALFMSHRILDLELFLKSTIAFVSFSLIASSVYIINDLFDLEDDRKHPSKKDRPFAAGKLSVQSGIISIPLLLFSGFLFSFLFLPYQLTATLLLYFVATTAYSFYLKEIVFIDVILLGSLYTLRIMAGGFATGIEVSSWLLGFSGFFFLSLAFMKRYTDLILFKKNSQEELFGRGYSIEDTDLVQKAGIASGFISLMILALYITSSQVLVLYNKPYILWLAIPVILYWLMNMWYVAHKGKMTDDPIIYAVKDESSYIVLVLTLTIIIIAATS